MARMHSTSNHVFNAALSGGLSRDDLDFLQRQIEDKAGRLGRMGNELYSRAQAVFDRYDFDAVRRSVRAIGRRISNAFSDKETLREFTDIADFQHAGLYQQRFLMAGVKLRSLVHKERAEGWQDTYIDEQPDEIGHRHLDYQRIMQGMPVTDEAGETYHVTYSDILHEEPMEIEDQTAQQRNWYLQDYFISLGDDDPSSPSNASL
ncbi:hypothetical protein ACLPJK_26200 [Pseudomonas aeruginosa]|uniref:hypothetical protein n=1 Tax=Pseudomonas aeruginosa TaxID=287 RepID=UPI003D26EDCE